MAILSSDATWWVQLGTHMFRLAAVALVFAVSFGLFCPRDLLWVWRAGIFAFPMAFLAGVVCFWWADKCWEKRKMTVNGNGHVGPRAVSDGEASR